MEEFDNFVKRNTTFLDNPYISGALTIFLIVYAGAVAPKLPEKIVKLFDYTFVKFLMFFTIVFVSRKNATVALIAAIAMMVSIMALQRLKFDKEMMEVVGTEENKSHKLKLNSCECTCNNFEEIKPKTDDGKLVAAEVVNAVESGALSEEKGQKLVKNIIANELQNLPVLVAKTNDGAKRMEEIAALVKNGQLDSEEGKKKVAIIVVAEAVVAQTVVEENMQKSEQTQEQFAVSSSNSANLANLAELAEEVIRKKQEKIAIDGVEPSEDDMKQLCVAVLSNHRKCKFGNCDRNYHNESYFSEPLNVSLNGSLNGSSNIPGIDPSEMSYAPTL